MTWLSDPTLRHLREVAAWPDLSGTKYTLVRALGRGGMGTVWLASDEELGREVALKVSNAPAAAPGLDARMRTEARVLARLEHPGIVPIHDAGRLADGRVFYAMKYVRGARFDEHARGLQTLEERLRVFERICEPVAFAHAHGTVHRDLKPANVMVGAFGEVLVMDWGVAKVLGDVPASGAARAPAADGASPGLTDAGTVVGTPGYMAPEQAAGRADEVGPPADVYALGAILFHLLTGTEPPAGARPDVHAALARPRGLPKRLRAICEKALTRDAAGRYAGAGELAEDIARFRAGRSVAAYPETWLDRAGRFVQRYRTPILLVLAYLIMRTIVALFFS